MQFFFKNIKILFFFLKAASCRDDNFEMMWLVAGLYDNAGYTISKRGIQNLIIFCPNINIAKRKLLYLLNRHTAKLRSYVRWLYKRSDKMEVLGCFGQSELQRKTPNCHKYATFSETFFLNFLNIFLHQDWKVTLYETNRSIRKYIRK